MNKPKICPFALIAGHLLHEAVSECKGDSCAWWTGIECAMLCVALTLGSLDTSGIIIHKED